MSNLPTAHPTGKLAHLDAIALPPGKIVLTRGLRRLMDVCATEAIMTAHIAEYGALPPQIAAILGRPVMG